MSSGPALMLRGNFAPLPRPSHSLDHRPSLAIRSPTHVRSTAPWTDHGGSLLGWGLGSHAFVLAGLGKITGDLGDGSRYFAEGGGGLNVGPFGVELGVKFAMNKLSEPVSHQFLTIPITLRGTLTF